MNKADLILKVARDAGLPQHTVECAVNVLLAQIAAALQKGNEVHINNFGSFSVHNRTARPGVNPRTGERMTIPACRVIRFAPGKHLRETIGRLRMSR